MSDRQGTTSSSSAGGYISGKMANDLSPKKTMVVLVIVVGCFAVLWPKVFYPMLLGSAHHIKPSPIDRTKGCCDVISETDVHTLKIMSHICGTILKPDHAAPLTERQLISECRSTVLDVCGIDLSVVLHQQIQLGRTSQFILDQVRSMNGSLCLKYNFGVAPWSLGVPHRVTVKVSPSSVKQERPLHLRSEMVHPAFRERGRAIPQSQPQEKPTSPSRLIPKVIVPGRPGPIPGMRPTIGGAGHVVPAPKQGTGSMGLIMPIYTVGIIIFFTYTVMKVLFKKQPESLYPSVDADATFRREVFESAKAHFRPRVEKESVSTKLVVNAMSALLDEVDQEISARHKASEVTDQDVVANGKIVNRDEDHASVKVLGMETTASCEGGQKWSRPDSPVLAARLQYKEPVEPPQEIYLEGSLPVQSHLLVTDSATEAQNFNPEEDPAVVLAGKMTLSVISFDSSDNLTDESSNSGKHDQRSSSNTSEDFEKIEVGQIEDVIEDVIEEAQNITVQQSLLDEIRNEINQNIDASLEVLKIDDDDSGKVKDQESINKNEKLCELPVTETVSIKPHGVEIEELEESIDDITERVEEAQNIIVNQSLLDEINQYEEDAYSEVLKTVDDPGKVEELVSENKNVSGQQKQSESSITTKTQGFEMENLDEKVEESKEVLLDQDPNIQEPAKNVQTPLKTKEIIEVTDSPMEQIIPGELKQLVAEEPIPTDIHNDSSKDVDSQLSPNKKTEDIMELNQKSTEENGETSNSENDDEDDEKEEEIEYEYEESDNDEVDEEIRNVERMGEGNEVLSQLMNGEDLDHSKNGTLSNDTLAENDISSHNDNSDEEEDDEVIEEIIEYVTDEEDMELIGNSINHMN